MQKKNLFAVLLFAATAITFTACQKNLDSVIPSTSPVSSNSDLISEKGLNPDEQIFNLDQSSKLGPDGGYVYTESNDSLQNEILIFMQAPSGLLTPMGTVASGGTGTGAGLGSQGAVILDNTHKWLFAVNAGSNSISSFKVEADGSLMLAHTAASEGESPISLSVNANVLYVVNAGSDNIAGFYISAEGMLTYIDGSHQQLSTSGAGAAQVSFSPNGNYLYVTEKATNMITTFAVDGNGVASPGSSSPSVGATPFGFEFVRDQIMVVSNAAGGAPGAGSATAYSGVNSGNLSDINGAVANNEGAPCWVATSQYGRFVYITNTASNSISSYYIGTSGSLHLAVSAVGTGGGPIDIVVSDNNYYVYSLNSVDHTIGQYKRTPLGGLAWIGTQSNLPVAAAGLAAF
ncbi:MAG: beta-propeller fold lactonase family protein [Chitinophagaceae bacterium]|nr:beta-propeller fold lactonase family protein [Chitinophagaceae bacterium]